jgi:hypothetical protein
MTDNSQEKELKLSHYPLSIGSEGPDVARVQEWLNLSGYGVSIDSDFGPATSKAVADFRKKRKLVNSPTEKDLDHVDEVLFKALVQPMTNACAHIAPGSLSLPALLVRYAIQHLNQHPREIGGQNKGPWVRLYMDGKQGKDWPWCAGFVSYCLHQAARSLNVVQPIGSSFCCDTLAGEAKKADRFVNSKSAAADPDKIVGSIFLLKSGESKWSHTGIVIDAAAGIVHTIEGNTNDDGSPEGYEVCRRTRPVSKLDFIRVT